MSEQNQFVLPSKDEEIQKLGSLIAESVQPLIDKANAEVEKKADERDNALLERIEKQVNDELEKFRAEREKIERKYDVPGAEGGDDGRRKGDKYNLARMGQASRLKTWEFAPFEKEVTDELYKNMGVDPDSGMGYLVPEFRQAGMIDTLKADSVIFELGARELMSPRGRPIKIVKLKTDATANWIGEGNTITASDLVVGQVSLEPRKLAARSILSNELIQDSPEAADKIVERSFVSQLQLGLDLAALNGTGNGQPVGVISLAANSHTFHATDYYVSLMSMLNTLAVDNALRGKLGWALHPTSLFNIQTTAGVSATDPEVSRRLMTENVYTNLLGYPYRTTTQLPGPADAALDGTIVFGNWDDLLVGMFSSIAIKGSDLAGDSFETDEFQVRGILRADCNVEHGESFCISVNEPA